MTKLFTIVGPSGVGKDSLLAIALAARPDIHVAQRVITRPLQDGGEPHQSCSEAEFARRLPEFSIHWHAHGLSYGIPAQELQTPAPITIFNGSRAALPAALAACPGLTVIEITASPEILAARLAARGRESEADIRARLARQAPLVLPAGTRHIRIENNSDLETAAAALLTALTPNDPY